MTNEVIIIDDLFKDAEEIAPEAPVVEVAAAAINTATNPSPENIVADIELMIKLINELKAKLAGVHPSILNIVKLMF